MSATAPQYVNYNANTTQVTANANTGYHFVNWTGDNGFVTTTSNPLSVLSVQKPYNLTANFAVDTYPVSYNDNGETSGTAPGNQTKTYGVDLTLASNTGLLEKTGHTFTGWNTQADGLGAHYAEGGTYSANAALALYAEWTPASQTLTCTPGTGVNLWGESPLYVNPVNKLLIY